MKLLLLNTLIILVTPTPLVLLMVLRQRSSWVEDNHEMLGIVVWIFTLLAVYIWVLPMLGLKPNPRFFTHY